MNPDTQPIADNVGITGPGPITQGDPPMTTATLDEVTLEDLFAFADLDDVSVDPDDGVVDIDFTIRATNTRHQAWGTSLADALVEAREIVARELTLRDLRRDGLTDDDIERLADQRFDTGPLVDEDGPWGRGYEAGIADAAHAAIAANAAIASVRPQQAFAAEPFSGPAGDPTGALQRHPLLSIVYAPVAMIQHPVSPDQD